MAKQKEKTNRSSKPNPEEGFKFKPDNAYIKYTSLGFQMIATILLGVFGGMYLDEYFEMSFPAFTAGLSLFSVIASMYLAIKELIQ
ncbi:AtpZ/AtpI family protein [Marinoscillum sp.]|uniref:AtpZ/AtpI family protein n=1 Tax=Marinoscillum sp. TaxID=2024838 RepID=UPI003BAA52C5